MTLEGAYASSWQATPSTQFKAFIEQFSKRIGRAPYLELAVIPTYDMASILVTCLSKAVEADGELSIPKLRDCIISTKNYQGLSGEISFDPDGAVRSIHEKLYKVEGGMLKEVVG